MSSRDESGSSLDGLGGHPLREVFSPRARLQRYLDVEAALALAEEELGIIPGGAGRRIAAAARVELLDVGRIAAEQAVTGHLMMPIVSELARTVGDPEGGWVHWGATTQNIQQSGDVLGLREAHRVITGQVCDLLVALSQLGERSAETVMAGRTHWQQAVPITFGVKVAAWSDPFLRHLDRLNELRPRLLRSMTGGAAGTFAALGPDGPAVQDSVARRLGLTPMTLPHRALVDPFAEMVCVLALIAATGAGLAEEVARLMSVEFGEVSESLPAGDVGSSTMPQKRNAKLCATTVATAARIRALVPLALEAMIQSHEVDGSRSTMMDHAVTEACVLTADLLDLLHRIAAGLEIHSGRMRANLDLTGGLISAEAIMMELGALIGRQTAHEVVHHAVTLVVTQEPPITFRAALLDDPRVTAHLTPAQIEALLDPTRHVGLSAELARQVARRARTTADRTRQGDPAALRAQPP